uniref:C2 domain-containing protein n=1 Tax=Panagrolaimus davidi TaxID=227884 RepID=A0A914P9V7_9BILA
MMGVIPGNRKKDGGIIEENSGGEDDTPPTSPNSVNKESHQKHGGMLHRFGGSFRRKIGSKKGTKSGTKGIPAKLIKASSVQMKTLNPKWNEKFQFIVDDVNADKFHLDIW